MKIENGKSIIKCENQKLKQFNRIENTILFLTRKGHFFMCKMVDQPYFGI